MKKVVLTLVAVALGFTMNAQFVDQDLAEISAMESNLNDQSRLMPSNLSLGAFEGINSSIYSVRLENDFGTFVEGGWRSESNLSALRGDNTVSAVGGMSLEMGKVKLSSGAGVLFNIGMLSVNDAEALFDFQAQYKVVRGISLATKVQVVDMKFSNVFAGLVFTL